MTEEKRNKIAAAITVSGVLLVIILFAVAIWQIIRISVLKHREDELIEQYNTYYKDLEEKESLLDNLKNDEEYKKWLMDYITYLGDEDPLGILK